MNNYLICFVKLGLGELICYSAIWFLLARAQLWTDAWQKSVYKHMVAAAAKENAEGYSLAGKYSLLGVFGSFVFMLPVNLVMAWW